MTAFQRTIVCIVLIASLLSLVKLHKSDMTIVYPDNCVFVIDHLFSQSMQSQIKQFIDDAYKKNKNASLLLPSIEKRFGAIKSVIIDMQSPEVLHFTIQAYKPMFVINHERVVCQYGKIFDKDVFYSDDLATLENISFAGALTSKNIDRLIQFFESLSTPVLNDFSIRWIDKHAIWLDQKNDDNNEDISLLVGYATILDQGLIKECRNLRGQISDRPSKNKQNKPCKNNVTWVCDVRFDKQVVLFSTNKGG